MMKEKEIGKLFREKFKNFNSLIGRPMEKN